MPEDRNIVLIGMPGSGKSTAGVILAKMTARNFVDTDILIQTSQGRSLQEIVDNDGHMALRDIEEKTILSLDCRNHVIATGGSAVYGREGMEHLKKSGVMFFLDVHLRVLISRVYDFTKRGLAKPSGQSFSELFDERINLYREYADEEINSNSFTQEEVCEEIIRIMNSRE